MSVAMPRKKKSAESAAGASKKSSHARVREDPADMLSVIKKVRDLKNPKGKWTIAEFLDPLIRDAVEEEFARIKPFVDDLKGMEE